MKFIFFAGIVFFIGSIILTISNHDEYRVGEHGHVVTMRIENLPASCIGSKVTYFVTFSYKGKLYDKRTRGNFCNEHHIGELMEVRMLEGSDRILWPNESGIKGLISGVGLGLFGLGIAIAAQVKMRRFKKKYKIK